MNASDVMGPVEGQLTYEKAPLPAERVDASDVPILVVEDDPDIRETLRSVLELEGHRVLCACQGLEGLHLLRKLGPRCVVILDLMMPVMSGEDFLRAVCDDEQLAGVPVVVLTAYTLHPPTLRGASAVLQKPIELGSLLELLDQLAADLGPAH
ncbi:MAG: response regulator [Myxococcota bacterium]